MSQILIVVTAFENERCLGSLHVFLRDGEIVDQDPCLKTEFGTIQLVHGSETDKKLPGTIQTLILRPSTLKIPIDGVEQEIKAMRAQAPIVFEFPEFTIHLLLDVVKILE